MHNRSVSEQIEFLTRGTITAVSIDELKRKLERGKPLRVKLGLDPTAPDLHLGHAVVLRKMQQFQECGHEVIFLIGDFTARIGDPTGKSKTRPPLDTAQIEQNMQTYFTQVSRILKKERLHIAYNSEWLGALTAQQFVELCARVTVSRIVEREDFSKRLKEQKPIGMHELLYPLLQGYDSVALKADVELGGTDQTFNLLMGRELQHHYGQEPQIVLTTPLLEGLDGHEKMSKSLGNYIGLTEPADQAFGKLMSISDVLMWRYFEVLLMTDPAHITKMQDAVAAGTVHPMNLKKRMAYEVVATFWGESDALAAKDRFERLFQERSSDAATELLVDKNATAMRLLECVKRYGGIESSAQAKRLIADGAISIDGVKATDPAHMLILTTGMILKLGKHKIFKVIVS